MWKTLAMTEAELTLRAKALSTSLVAGLGRRWLHVQQVAHRAEQLAPAVAATNRPHLVAAAWLHDVGYAPKIVVTGFHSLDGARYLAAQGWPDVLVQLVAHHTGAWSEATERGL